MKQRHAAMSEAQWSWPDELDALVASPENHTLLFENEFVRVLETVIRPGETTSVHTHRWAGAFYVQSWSDFVRRDGKGDIMADTREAEPSSAPPQVLWLESMPPHTLENVGSTKIRGISVEVKE